MLNFDYVGLVRLDPNPTQPDHCLALLLKVFYG